VNQGRDPFVRPWTRPLPGRDGGSTTAVAAIAASAIVAALLAPAGTRAEGTADTKTTHDALAERAAGALATTEPTSPIPPGLAIYEDLARREPAVAAHHQLLATAYARQGRTDEARRAARRALELAPDDAELHQTIGLIEEGADDLEAARIHFSRAAALDGNVEYRLDVARVLARLDRRSESDAAFAAIVTAFSPPALVGDAAANVQMALADSYRGLGRYDDANAAWERAVSWASSPDKRVDALIEKARMLADRGDSDAAVGTLVRARDLATDDADVHYNLGVLLVRTGQLDAGIAAFDAALRVRPDFAHALNNKGIALERQQKLDEARQAFAAAGGADPGHLLARHNLGLVLFKQRRFAEAEPVFTAILQLDPTQADAKFFLGETYFQLGETTKALRLYKDALRSNPDDGMAHGRLGDLHLAAGALDEAIDEFWAAIDADKGAVDRREQLIRVLLVRNNDGDVRRAVKLGEEGIDLDPGALGVRTALAAALTQHGQSPRARDVLEAGILHAPRDPRPLTALGRHFLEQGRTADAQAAFTRALALDDRHAPALAGDGEAALSQGHNDLARQRFEAALVVDPTLADARAELGYLLYKAGRNDDAIAALMRATEDAPRLGKAWFYLAFAQFKAGRRTDVEASLRRAVAVQPDLAEAWLQLGKVQLQAGHKDEAKRSFLAAEKARGGTYEEARLELERLR
jgi:tetratricopeptide (TPR) repeat protein